MMMSRSVVPDRRLRASDKEADRPSALVVGRSLPWCRRAVALLVLALPVAAGAADGKQVMECIKRAESTGMASMDNRELIAAVACKGTDGASAGFARALEVNRECFKKVTFQVQARGTEAEIIAASACSGAIDAAQTAKCMDLVARQFRSAKDTDAERLAAMACARGNAASETAECVGYVSFRVSTSGVSSDVLAAIACGK